MNVSFIGKSYMLDLLVLLELNGDGWRSTETRHCCWNVSDG